jgi:TP901-1 family phage major tail protein
MAAQTGLTLVLKIGDGGGPETFTTIAGAQTNAITTNNEQVDVTNKSSSRMRQLLAGAGITSFSTTISGVYTADATEESLRTAANANTIGNYQIVIPDGGTNVTYEGAFQISSYANTGEYNGAVTFEATLESAGDITIT